MEQSTRDRMVSEAISHAIETGCSCPVVLMLWPTSEVAQVIHEELMGEPIPADGGHGLFVLPLQRACDLFRRHGGEDGTVIALRLADEDAAIKGWCVSLYDDDIELMPYRSAHVG